MTGSDVAGPRPLDGCSVVALGASHQVRFCAEVLGSLGAAVRTVPEPGDDPAERGPVDVVLTDGTGQHDLGALGAGGEAPPVVIDVARAPGAPAPALERLDALGMFHRSGESAIAAHRSGQRRPVAPAGHLADHDTAMAAAFAVLLSRFDAMAGRTPPSRFEVATRDVLLSLNRQDLAAEVQAEARGTADVGPLVSLCFACADGQVVTHLGSGNRKKWREVILAADGGADDPGTGDELVAAIGRFVRDLPRDEIEELGQARGIPVTGVRRLSEVLVDDQLEHRGFFERTGGGELVAASVPFLLNGRRPTAPDRSPSSVEGR